jgi:uncharacterized protein YjiS (DUF1127 family)
MIKNLFSGILRMLAERRAQRALRELDDRMLRDIGLRRDQL